MIFFSWNTRFEIRPFTVLPTISNVTKFYTQKSIQLENVFNKNEFIYIVLFMYYVAYKQPQMNG